MAKKVLIVEDTADILEALKWLIELEGYEAMVANDGLEGVRMAAEHIPDLILMDLAMPGLSGIDATRQIRSDPKTSVIPIVCVTSHAGKYEAEAVRAGCNEVHTKTSFMDNFEPVLKKYLEMQTGVRI
jgi:CheY-like chemotaxis protein